VNVTKAKTSRERGRGKFFQLSLLPSLAASAKTVRFTQKCKEQNKSKSNLFTCRNVEKYITQYVIARCRYLCQRSAVHLKVDEKWRHLYFVIVELHAWEGLQVHDGRRQRRLTVPSRKGWIPPAVHTQCMRPYFFNTLLNLLLLLSLLFYKYVHFFL